MKKTAKDIEANVYWKQIPPTARVELRGKKGAQSYIVTLPDGLEAVADWGSTEGREAQAFLDKRVEATIVGDRERALLDYRMETLAQESRDDAQRREHPFIPFEHDRLNGVTLALPPCGCNVTGRGTLPFPIRIKFCDRHARA